MARIGARQPHVAVCQNVADERHGERHDRAATRSGAVRLDRHPRARCRDAAGSARGGSRSPTPVASRSPSTDSTRSNAQRRASSWPSRRSTPSPTNPPSSDTRVSSGRRRPDDSPCRCGNRGGVRHVDDRPVVHALVRPGEGERPGPGVVDDFMVGHAVPTESRSCSRPPPQHLSSYSSVIQRAQGVPLTVPRALPRVGADPCRLAGRRCSVED